jgi:hypothetical protein
MNFRTRLIGAIDAVILALAAIVTVAISIELIDPHAGRPEVAQADASLTVLAEHSTKPSARL